MSEPYLSEIRMVGFNFAPRSWALCDGQILPINQNQSLYSLLGTAYGGDGRTSFALPDLRGRTPIHMGQNGSSGGHTLGEKGGEDNHLLTTAEIPNHTHTLSASSDPASTGAPGANPAGKVLAQSPLPVYHAPSQPVNMATTAVANSGSSQSHTNMQPYLTVNFCIALSGLFPSRN